jgi:hypothetical protein
MNGEYEPTLQCTNQLSVDLRTVPRIPMRQCCFVRVRSDVVGGSVYWENVGEARLLVKTMTYTGATVGRRVRPDPYNIFASPVSPFCQDLSASLQSLPGATSNPHENEGGIGGKGRYRKILQVVPCER